MEGNANEHGEGDLLEDVQEEVKKPDMWRVILLNDDYTPRDFVVMILVSIFHKPVIEATKIMMKIHTKGRGVVGLYPFDIGKTKIGQVKKLARENEFPLESIMERA